MGRYWLPVLIAVHRLVLLDERADRGVWQIPAEFSRFFLWMFGLNMVLSIPSIVTALVKPPETPLSLPWSIVMMIYLVAACFVMLRTLILFPALAAAPNAASLASAWHDSKGHVWRMLGVSLLAFLPLLLAYFVALIPLLVTHGATEVGRETYGLGTRLGLIGVQSASTMLMVTIFAVVASRFFQTYTMAPPRP